MSFSHFFVSLFLSSFFVNGREGSLLLLDCGVIVIFVDVN
jgi:hypothetical protein